ncbi:hypothetical protein CR513_60297, partial [Mucuna pruriens]
MLWDHPLYPLINQRSYYLSGFTARTIRKGADQHANLLTGCIIPSFQKPSFLLEANYNKSAVQIPKKLSHEEIISKVPEEWLLEEIIEEPKIYHNQIREIIQDGPNIRLKMNRSNSLNINEPQVIYKGQPSRYYVDGSDLDLKGLKINKIVELVYSENSESPNYSPTRSQVLNTLIRKEPFEIDKIWIRKDFEADYNANLRNWVFNAFIHKQTKIFRQIFYDYMNKKKLICISLIGVIDNNWKTKDNEIIRSEYPPQQTITIEFARMEIEASPFKDTIKDLDKAVDKTDIKKLHSQMNYSNIVLGIMSKQLTRIEGIKNLENKDLPSTSTSKPPIKPIYKLINVPQKELESIKLDNNTNIKIEEIKQRLEKLTIDKNSINTIEVNKLRNYPKLRNYYPRPSPVDVQFEERGELVQNSFSGSEIVEWNIDGLSDQAILDITCQIKK